MARPTLPGFTRNRLLSALSPEDQFYLRPHLMAVALDVRQVLEKPNEPIEHIYFPESGLGSIVAADHRQRRIEVGIFGREGMSGSTVVTGNHRSPHETFVQVAGFAQRVEADHLRKAMRRSAPLQGLLLRYVTAFMVQTAHTALSNGSSKIDERLARWLLMSGDRLDTADIPLTHEFLAVMLGVQRPGVTLALRNLERRGVIKATRSKITVTDREGLLGLTNSSYGIPESEMKRLVG